MQLLIRKYNLNVGKVNFFRLRYDGGLVVHIEKVSLIDSQWEDRCEWNFEYTSMKVRSSSILFTKDEVKIAIYTYINRIGSFKK